MKSLTIHNMDDEMANAIKELAEKSGLSQNKIIKKLLRKSLGLSEKRKPQQDFSEFCGLWTAAEEQTFEEAISDFEHIDETMWA